MSETPPSATASGTAADGDAATEPTLVQRLLAELIGSFVLVLAVAGAITITAVSYANQFAGFSGPGSPELEASDLYGNSGYAPTLAAGFALVGVGFAFGRVSGGHFNPVLSLAAALAGRMRWVDAVMYAGAQLVGAIVATVVVFVTAAGLDGFDAFKIPVGASGWGDKGTGLDWWAALILETVLTAILVLVFLAATDRRNPSRAWAPVMVALTFAGIYVLSIPTLNGGENPAKSIATAIFSGSDPLLGVWVFVIAPLLGTAIAAVVYVFLFGSDGEQVAGGGIGLGVKKSKPAGQPWGQPGAAPGYPQQGYGQAPGGYGQPYQGQPGPQAGAQPGGYGQSAPASSDPGPAPQAGGQSAQGSGSASGEQPIIQDGWQWDPQAQQWIPAQQQPGGWGGDSTQVRPPQ